MAIVGCHNFRFAKSSVGVIHSSPVNGISLVSMSRMLTRLSNSLIDNKKMLILNIEARERVGRHCCPS